MLRVSVVSVALVALAASGCGGGSHRAAETRSPTVRHCARGTRQPVGSSELAWAAAARRPTTAYRSPGGAAIRRFGLANVNGAATVFGVLGKELDARCRAAWLHVALPIRPNGATGWVRAGDVQQLPVRTRITVDLSERRVWLYKKGKLVLSSAAAIGSSATPTPLGRYYVNQRLIAGRPERPLRPRRRRHLGLLGCADRLDTGRPDRDPRHERAVVDRARRVERLHPSAEHRSAARLRGGARRDARADQAVGHWVPTAAMCRADRGRVCCTYGGSTEKRFAREAR